jgi:tetratricopeptide (TPR) repeat protein
MPEAAPVTKIDFIAPERKRGGRARASVRGIMAGRYGMSFAKKHIEEGDYEEAVKAATEALEGGDESPEPLVDRATAYDLLERHAEAVADFEAAILKNNAEKELDPFLLDDAYFSATLACARAEAMTDLKMALARLDHYREVVPDGAHVAESRDWQKRLKGEMPSLLDKTKALDS